MDIMFVIIIPIVITIIGSVLSTFIQRFLDQKIKIEKDKTIQSK